MSKKEEKQDKGQKPEEEKERPKRTVITFVFTEEQKRILGNY